MDCYVLDLEAIDRTQVAVVGGKGAHLGELSRIEGLRVPDGYCVTTDAFQRIMADAPSIDDRLDRLSRLKTDDREAIRTLVIGLLVAAADHQARPTRPQVGIQRLQRTMEPGAAGGTGRPGRFLLRRMDVDRHRHVAGDPARVPLTTESSARTGAWSSSTRMRFSPCGMNARSWASRQCATGRRYARR